MRYPLRCVLGALTLSAVLVAAGPAAADPPDHAQGWKQARHDVDDWHDRDGRDDDRDEWHDGRDPRHRDDADWYDDRHHHHQRVHPRRGYVVAHLPYGHRLVHHRGDRYYYGDGVWYRPYGSRFVVVSPPIGLTIPFRPDFHATLWFGGVPYYEANSVYFVWQPKRRAYVVAHSPW